MVVNGRAGIKERKSLEYEEVFIPKAVHNVHVVLPTIRTYYPSESRFLGGIEFRK